MEVSKLIKEFPNSILIDLDNKIIWCITPEGVRMTKDKTSIIQIINKEVE